jgi:hypothetical protein
MDTVAASYVVSVLANTVTLSLEKVYDEWRRESSAMVPRLSQAHVRRAIDEEQELADPSKLLSNPSRDDVDAIKRFLMSADVGALVIDLFAFSITGVPPGALDAHSRRCYWQLRFYGLSPDAASEAATNLSGVFRSLVSQLPIETKPSRRRDKKAAERLVAARRQIAERHAERLEEQLSILTTLLDKDRVDINALNRDISLLRTAMQVVHGSILPPSVETTQRVPIEDLYVPVTVETNHLKSDVVLFLDDDGEWQEGLEETNVINASILPAELPGLWASNRRTVILGTPGAGKTTLVEYIAKISADGDLAGFCEVAIPIIVRKHIGATSSSQGIDFVGAIRATCLERYQMDLSRQKIQFMLNTGRLALLIDGLDELLATQDRLAVVQSIEALARVYPDCLMVATSRVVGYEQAPLTERLFARSELQPLTEEGVRAYATKWYNITTQLSDPQLESMVENFIEDSNSIPDLRENALLLSLLCSLYRHERHLPRNRPLVYKACADLLFDTWDRRRQLRPAFDFDAHVSGAVEYIARYIFADQARQSGVTEAELLDVAAKYFREWQYSNDAEANRAAREFLEFCKGRAWILTDTGASRQNVALFQFSHRTFLEYFTAVDLVRSLNEQELLELFQTQPRQASWNVVCQIVLQLASSKQRGLEDLLVQEILHTAAGLRDQERQISLYVAAQSLSAVPYKPGTVQAVVTKALDEYLTKAPVSSTRGTSGSRRDDLNERSFWLGGTTIAIENHQAASAIVDETLNEMATTAQRLRFAVGHLIDFHLVEGVTPAALHDVISAENRRRLRKLLTGSPPSWLFSCALLLGHSESRPSWSPGREIFRTVPGGVIVAGVQSPWSGHRLPTVMEIALWGAAHAMDSDAPVVGDLISNYAAPALDVLMKSQTIVGFEPHWIWHSIGPLVGSEGWTASPPEGEFPYKVLITMAFALTELYALGTGVDVRRKMRNLARRDWGRLGIVPAALRERYGVDGPELGADARHYLQSLGLLTWATRRKSLLSISRARK